MAKTFIEGDRVQVLPLDYLKPRLRNANGTVTAWCHDDLYEVAIDDGFNAVLEASEMTHVPQPN